MCGPRAVDVTNKDIVLAIFAGAVRLSGLLLVFQGFIVGAYTTLPTSVPQVIKRSHRRAVRGAFIAVVIALASIADCLLWLLTQWGFCLVIILFGATLLAVLAVGAFASFVVVN